MTDEREYPVTVPFEPFLHEQFRDPEFMRAWLDLALEDYEKDRNLDELLDAVATARDALRGAGQKRDVSEEEVNG